jgi:hypothetical protein
MAIESYFFNAIESEGTYDRVYNAEDVTSYLNQIVGNGVFPNPSTQLQVRASSGMNVIVGAGSGWINGHKLVNTADLTLTLDASDVLLDRCDAVIFYVDYDAREMGIEVKKGTLAATAVPLPTLTRTNSRYEMCLAFVTVPRQITNITAVNIIDVRGNSTYCGYVQGLIQQVDTSTLWTQQQAQFDDWFEGVQGQFEAGKLFKKLEGIYTTTQENEASFTVTDYIPSYAFAYDILEIFINGFHLNSNEYTLSNNTVTLEIPISTAGAVVDFVVYKSVDPDA